MTTNMAALAKSILERMQTIKADADPSSKLCDTLQEESEDFVPDLLADAAELAKLVLAGAGPVHAALDEFIETVRVTGGVEHNRHVERPGHHVVNSYSPFADPEWTDLGAAYVQACEAMGYEALIVKGEGVEA